MMILSSLFQMIYFNPRSREGSDLEIAGPPLDVDISIHAPARGATDTLIGKGYPDAYNFNPRSREGSDVLPEV